MNRALYLLAATPKSIAHTSIGPKISILAKGSKQSEHKAFYLLSLAGRGLLFFFMEKVPFISLPITEPSQTQFAYISLTLIESFLHE